MRENFKNSPLDGEAGHAGLLGQHVALDTLDDGLGGGLVGELLRVVLIVHVVAHADKLATVVGAGQEDDGDAQDVGVGDAADVGVASLEDELVLAYGDRADEDGVQFLIILVAKKGKGGAVSKGGQGGRQVVVRWQRPKKLTK